MKKLFTLIFFASIVTISYAQTNNNSKSTPVKVDVEVVFNKQVEILNARIDSMNIAHEEAIEMVKNEQKEQYSNYYSQMDSDLDRSLVILSIIWGAMGLLFGVVAPIWLNAKAEKSLKNEICKFYLNVIRN